MKLDSHKPRHYHDDRHHSEYGLYKWFVSKGIVEEQMRDEIIEQFLGKYKFHNNPNYKPNFTLKEKKIEFIQKRFGKFCHFAFYYNPLTDHVNYKKKHSD